MALEPSLLSQIHMLGQLIWDKVILKITDKQSLVGLAKCNRSYWCFEVSELGYDFFFIQGNQK